jgi:hypothetical protein
MVNGKIPVSVHADSLRVSSYGCIGWLGGLHELFINVRVRGGVTLFPVHAQLTSPEVEFVKGIPSGSGIMLGDGAFDAKPVLNAIASGGYIPMVRRGSTSPRGYGARIRDRAYNENIYAYRGRVADVLHSTLLGALLIVVMLLSPRGILYSLSDLILVLKKSRSKTAARPDRGGRWARLLVATSSTSAQELCARLDRGGLGLLILPGGGTGCWTEPSRSSTASSRLEGEGAPQVALLQDPHGSGGRREVSRPSLAERLIELVEGP